MFITEGFKPLLSKDEKNQILKLTINFSSAVIPSYKRLFECFSTLQIQIIKIHRFSELNFHYDDVSFSVERAFFKSNRALTQKCLI